MMKTYEEVYAEFEKKYWGLVPSISILKTLGVMLLGFLVFWAYIGFWVRLYNVIGWPAIVLGILSFILISLKVNNAKFKSKCDNCGSRDNNIIDSYIDIGYQVADFAKCKNCGYIRAI